MLDLRFLSFIPSVTENSPGSDHEEGSWTTYNPLARCHPSYGPLLPDPLLVMTAREKDEPMDHGRGNRDDDKFLNPEKRRK